VSVMSTSRMSLRLLGRSYLAFVLAPDPPFDEWLSELDARLLHQSAFFSNRPVILDLAALAPNMAVTRFVVDAIESRGLRLVAVEGVDPDWVGPRLAPLPGTPMPIGMFNPKELDGKPPPRQSRFSLAEKSDANKPAASLLVEEPLRSGQSLIFPQGDVTVIGSVASGAEIAAGGSIHIYGALRGRAFAGTNGNAKARIFCNRFDAELLVIDGLYKTADDFDPALRGAQVQARLDRDVLNVEVFH
jgi:septum site-determining protein MinC